MDSRLLDVLEEAFGEELVLIPDLGSLEAAVQAKLRTLGLGLLQRILRQQPSGYKGSRRRCGCGGRARFVAHRRRQVHTVFGWGEVSRTYYHCPVCGQGSAPYDEAAGLGTEILSRLSRQLLVPPVIAGRTITCRNSESTAGAALID